jgi:hypothetical protein
MNAGDSTAETTNTAARPNLLHREPPLRFMLCLCRQQGGGL